MVTEKGDVLLCRCAALEQDGGAAEPGGPGHAEEPVRRPADARQEPQAHLPSGQGLGVAQRPQLGTQERGAVQEEYHHHQASRKAETVLVPLQPPTGLPTHRRTVHVHSRVTHSDFQSESIK